MPVRGAREREQGSLGAWEGLAWHGMGFWTHDVKRRVISKSVIRGSVMQVNTDLFLSTLNFTKAAIMLFRDDRSAAEAAWQGPQTLCSWRTPRPR